MSEETSDEIKTNVTIPFRHAFDDALRVQENTIKNLESENWNPVNPIVNTTKNHRCKLRKAKP